MYGREGGERKGGGRERREKEGGGKGGEGDMYKCNGQ